VIIERQVAGVQFAIGKPAVDAVFILGQHLACGLVPVELAGFFGPELFRILD
jgi:hypothetical protein